MTPKLQDYMDRRIPLFLRLKEGIIYYQLMAEIASDDGLSAGKYCEYDTIKSDCSCYEIGQKH